jgi:hypothetical protein
MGGFSPFGEFSMEYPTPDEVTQRSSSPTKHRADDFKTINIR